MPLSENDAAQTETDLGKVVTFPQGIPGFETYTKYTVFHKQENNVRIYWLESIESPKVTFTLVDPTDYGLNYALDLSDEETNMLEANDASQLAVLMMLSKKQEGDEEASSLHANIAGPIVMNLEKRLGMQKVLSSARVDVNIVQS